MKCFHRFPLALLAATAHLFQGCDQPRVIAGGSDDTHSSLEIQGRVLTKDASPFGKVIVRLRRLGIADTTDDNGRFRIASKTLGAPESGGRWIDTLDYFRDGQAIHSVAVPTTIWTAPDLYLVQRDFSGNVEGYHQSLQGIWMDIVQGDGGLRRIELEWNAPQHRFSGFAYFRYQAGVDSFTAIAQAIDSSGKVVGRSDSTNFTSRAGDVVLPPFSALNLLPALTMGAQCLADGQSWAFLATDSSLGVGTDSLLAGRGQTVRVLAEIKQNLERFQRVEWNLDGKGWVRSSQVKGISLYGKPGTSHPIYDTTFKIFPSVRVGQRLVLRVRSVTFDSVIVEDSVAVRIMRTPPMAGIEAILPNPDPSKILEGIAPKTPIRVRFQDSTFWGGKIVSRKLYIGEIRPVLDVVTGECVMDSKPDSGWSNPTRTDTGCGYQTYTTHEEFHALGGAIPVSGADTTIEAPAMAGMHQLLYEVVDGNGDTMAIRSNRISILDPAPVITKIQVVGDSVVVGWAIPGEDTLLNYWHYWTIAADYFTGTGNRSRLNRDEYHPWHTTVLHPSIETRAIHLRLSRKDGFSKDTTFPIAPRKLTFTGAIGNESRMHVRADGIGGFRGLFSAAVGQYLSGEVGRLSWFSEDSTSRDGALALISLPCMGNDTLSLDLASPTTAPIRIGLLSRDGSGFESDAWRYLQADSIELGWDIPAGTQGHLDLALASATWSQSPLAWMIESLPYYPQLIAGVVLRIQQTSEVRIKQGFIEVDNAVWH